MPYVAPTTITHTTVPSHVAGEVYPAADYQTLVTDVNQMGSGYNTIVNDILNLRALANVTQSTTTTATIIAGTTYLNTGLSGTITPTFSDSKVLIHITQWFSSTPNAADIGFSTVKVVRGSTDIWLPVTTNRTPVQLNATGLGAVGTFWTFTYLDSPASITATVYKTMVRTAGAAYTITAQADSIQSQIVLQEIPA